MAEELETSHGVPVVEARLDFGLPGDAIASEAGAGATDILKVIKILEDAGITCCVAGAGALIWFGAGRVRGDWEICVPTERFDEAANLLKTPPHDNSFMQWRPGYVQVRSLHHTFPRFKFKGIDLRFLIFPAGDCHIDCVPSQLERSASGIPYPKLEVIAQSLLDTRNEVDLADLIDGMNLSEEWCEEHLDLDRTVDVEWAERKEAKIMASVPPGEDPFRYGGHSFDPVPLRGIWEESVRGKERRISKGLPTEYFATRWYAHGAEDPRLTTRDYV